MRREEVSRRTGVVAAPPAGQELAGAVEDADPAAGRVGGWYGGVGPTSGVKAEFGDVNLVVAVDENLAWASHVRPLGHVLAVGFEDLDPAVFAVGHVHHAITIDGNAVG